MNKLKSIEDFRLLKNMLFDSKEGNKPTIIISAGTCGQASGANDLIRIIKRELLNRNLTGKINLRITGCHGFCEMEPSVLVEPFKTFYPKVSPGTMAKIIGVVANGDILKDKLYFDENTGKRIEKQDDIQFFKKQTRTILSRNEKMDPIRVYNYIENGGYCAIIKILEKATPESIVNKVKNSGLRGRGGAGFPTGIKWELLAKQPKETDKYIVCNADEGDPGAYMDRSILEGNPHSIIEGMLICAYCTGATNGVVYVRKEYPLAIKHLIIALRQAKELGLLGRNILGTEFTFDIQIVKGAGAFVCGEETALIRSIEGKMGEPRQRPPYPIQKGINGKPTVINNVETWANISLIFQVGTTKFSKIGTKNNSGTKIFSLVGKIKNTGLIEVPMGMSIKEIVYEIGGGSPGKVKIKAVQTGGPSGGCIPVNKFDLPIDYDSLSKVGSIMGSGGMIVMDENTCMVDVARYFMAFLKDESCGKCFTCRKGTQRMYEILDDISKGKGTLKQLDLLEELAIVVKDTTMCGLGQTASNPVLSTLKYYRDEYFEHIVNKRCPAGVCNELVGAPCQDACPLGTEAWRYIAHIARVEYKEAYLTIRKVNPFPSVCARVCSHPCEDRCRSGASGGQSIAIRTLKRFITDRINPTIYKPIKVSKSGIKNKKVAIVGSGPAGLTAAHYLSLRGYKVTIFEKDIHPGGMLNLCIPSYRMPRNILTKEIELIINSENITLKCHTALGSDITIKGLFKDGYNAIFLAMGAHKSKLLNIEGEDLDGVYPAVDFLKAFNKKDNKLTKGNVGIIGGGDSAVDAARVAVRQKDVKSVTLLYRRTRQEMPALKEEVDAALMEGVKLKTLISPIKIHSKKKCLKGIECIKNKQGDVDASGRRRPISIPGTEHIIPLDNLIITIGDAPDIDYISSMGINMTKWGTIKADKETLSTNMNGVFAGGDVVTGPNTVIDAIATGKKADVMIHRYLCGEELIQTPKIELPQFYIKPPEFIDDEPSLHRRVVPPTIPIEARKRSLHEVEMTISVDEAKIEAMRCLRCDLEFTENKESKNDKIQEIGGKTS